jgi:hypothetical protein
MDYLDKIKLVSNHKTLEHKPSGTEINIPYVYIPSTDEIKATKRNYFIDNILDIESNDDSYSEFDIPSFTENVITPRVISKVVKSSQKSEKEIWDDIIGLINSITSKGYYSKISPGKSYDLQKLNKPEDTIIREFILKITMGSQLIAMDSRMGPAKTLITNPNLKDLIEKSGNFKLLEIDLIYDQNIPPNRVILCRNNGVDMEGIIRFNYQNNWWCLNTDNFEKMFFWFNII